MKNVIAYREKLEKPIVVLGLIGKAILYVLVVFVLSALYVSDKVAGKDYAYLYLIADIVAVIGGGIVIGIMAFRDIRAYKQNLLAPRELILLDENGDLLINLANGKSKVIKGDSIMNIVSRPHLSSSSTANVHESEMIAPGNMSITYMDEGVVKRLRIPNVCEVKNIENRLRIMFGE